MRTKQTKKLFSIAALLIAAISTIFPAFVAAENGTPASAPAEMISTASQPDVQIVVSPDVNGHWVVAAVYPSKTDRKKAETRAREMLSLGNWKGKGLIFENKALERSENEKGLAPPTVMSSVTVSTPGNIVNYADGTIALEPFIRAYRDLGRLHLLFLVPGSFQYRGPRSYSDNDIQVNYSAGGSALTYIVQVKNPNLKSLRLPRLESVAAAVKPSAAAPKTGGNNTGKMLAVIGLALAAAGLAFYGVQRWNHR